MVNSFPVNGATVNGSGDAVPSVGQVDGGFNRRPVNSFQGDGVGLYQVGDVAGGFNRRPINSFEGVSNVLLSALSQDIDFQVFNITGELSQFINFVVTDVGTGALAQDIEFDVFDPVTGTGSLAQDINFQVFTPIPANAHCWRAVVTLEAVGGDAAGESGDISATVAGTISVEAEESAARIASFVREPRPLGPCPTETDPEFLDLQKHVGRTLDIDYVLLDDDGTTVLSTTRVFTGFVDEVEYDPNTRLTTYTCSDGRQLKLENADRATIDALTPDAFYSPFVFDETADNLQYAEDRLSTRPRTLDLDSSGNWRYTQFAAGAPTFTYDESGVVYETLAVNIEKYRDITTEVTIETNYNFTRLREREVTFSWSYPGSFCDYLDSGHTLPKKEMVVSAANGGSWRLVSVTFGNLPPSQLFSCSAGDRIWVNSGNGEAPLFTDDVSGRLAKRFTTGVTETYELRVLAPDSASQFGTVKETLSASLTAEFDEQGWTSEGERVEQALIDRNPYNTTTTQSVSTGDFGYPTTTQGTDRYYDAVDDDSVDEGEGRREDLEDAIETLIEQGKRIILQNHRQNTVSWDAIMLPQLELYHTVEVDTCQVNARGKCSAFTHRMDIDSGEAITNMTISVSKVATTGTPETPTAAPAPPDTTSGMGSGSTSLSLGTRYGGQQPGSLFCCAIGTVPSPPITADPYPGYQGNRSPGDVGSLLYPVQFQIETEEIDETDRDTIEETQTADYNVAVPDELLNLQA